MNTNTNRTRTSTIAAVWADVVHAQRRMIELNRPTASAAKNSR